MSCGTAATGCSSRAFLLHGSAAAADVAQRAIPRDERFVAPGARAVATAARRAHEHAVAALQHVLLAIVDARAVDADVAEAAGRAAGEAGGGELRALGHDAQHDRARRAALDQDVLAEAAAEEPGSARAPAQALVVDEERALRSEERRVGKEGRA